MRLSITATLILGLGRLAFAQEPAKPPALGYQDSFQMNATDIGSEAALVVTNAGFHDQPDFPVTTSNICANVYVFAPGAFMLECCSCPVRANERVLIGYTKFIFSLGSVFKVVATLPSRAGVCDPTATPNGLGVPGGFASGMVGNLSQRVGGSANPLFSPLKEKPLGTAELSKLTNQCRAVPAVFQCQCIPG